MSIINEKIFPVTDKSKFRYVLNCDIITVEPTLWSVTLVTRVLDKRMMLLCSLHINTMSIWLIYYNTLVVYSLLTSLSRNNMILCRSSTCPMINLSSSMLLLSSTSSSFDDNSIILDPESNSVDVKISPLINGDHYSLTTSDILSLESIRSTLVRQGK